MMRPRLTPASAEIHSIASGEAKRESPREQFARAKGGIVRPLRAQAGKRRQ